MAIGAAALPQTALDRFARTAGANLSYDAALVSGLRSGELSGNHSIADGLNRLLAGSGLKAVTQPGGDYSLRKASQAAAAATAARSAEATLPMVTVMASSEALPGEPLKPYAGGQVARGGRVGMLGDRDIMNTPFSVTRIYLKIA